MFAVQDKAEILRDFEEVTQVKDELTQQVKLDFISLQSACKQFRVFSWLLWHSWSGSHLLCIVHNAVEPLNDKL